MRAYHETFGVPVLLTNCSNNYGPYQFPEKLVPLMILNALDGKPLPIYGKGQNIRDWLHVEDHCAAILRVLEAGVPGEKYNVGGNSERTNLEVVHALCAALEAAAPGGGQPGPGRQGRGQLPRSEDLRRRSARPRPALRHRRLEDRPRARLQRRPTRSIPGLAATVRWYLDHQDWCEAVTARQVRPGAARPEGLTSGAG